MYHKILYTYFTLSPRSTLPFYGKLKCFTLLGNSSGVNTVEDAFTFLERTKKSRPGIHCWPSKNKRPFKKKKTPYNRSNKVSQVCFSFRFL